MATSASVFPNSASTPFSKPWKQLQSSHKQFNFTPHLHRQKKQFPVIALASSISIPINVDYLDTEFGRHGVSFESIGDNYVLKMATENGSTAKLMMPFGLITSYKPFMWHEGTMEVLQTTVSEGQGGEAVVRGGVSMDFKVHGEFGVPWSPKNWSLRDVRGDPNTSIQVELISVAPMNALEVKSLVTLHQDLLASELMITNLTSSAVQLSGSFLTHLKVSTPDATYSAGMQGSSYRSNRAVSSEFCIIPPKLQDNSSLESKFSWAQKALSKLFDVQESSDENDMSKANEAMETEGYSEGEEDEDYAHLTDQTCRIYTSAPREFTIIDRGRRNSIIMSRSGLDEIYLLSPGSDYEWYGEYAFICLGPSALLKPVVLGPGDTWQGSQFLQNPNV